MHSVRPLVVATTLLVGGCVTSDVYSSFGESPDLYTGKMTNERIEMANAKGTRCVGQVGRTAAGIPGGDGVLHAAMAIYASANRTPTHAVLTCDDGQRISIQFAPQGSGGYGIGRSTNGDVVRATYGLDRQQAAPHLSQAVAAAPSPGPGTPPAAPAAERKIGSGTGFFISRQGHVMTNAHVVDKCKSVTVSTVGGTAQAASVVNVDKANDLAVLQASAAPSAVAGLRGPRPVRQGETVVAYGFPFAGSLSSGGVMTSGNVNALAGLGDDSRYLQMSAPVQPGNSGGPLIDTTGAVVGVVTAALAARAGGRVPQNVNFALKAEVIRTFLGSVGVTPETVAGGELALPDIGERARRYTVLVECSG